jgi:hypothetical protein
MMDIRQSITVLELVDMLQRADLDGDVDHFRVEALAEGPLLFEVVGVVVERDHETVWLNVREQEL